MHFNRIITLIGALSINMVCGQYVRYTMYESTNGCGGMGTACNYLRSGQCCFVANTAYASVSTDLWMGVDPATTRVHAKSSAGANYCANDVRAITKDECYIGGLPQAITGGSFVNGVWLAGKGKGGCTEMHPVDEYVFKKGDVRYSLSAHNVTHAAVMAFASVKEQERYILANFEVQEIANVDGKLTRFRVQG